MLSSREGQVTKKMFIIHFLREVTISSHVTHHPDCTSNSSQEESSFPLCQPPKTNIDDAEDATAKALRGATIGAAAAASPVSKLTTSTLVQASGILSRPPIMYSLPEMIQHKTTIPSKPTSLLVVIMLKEGINVNEASG